MCTSPLVEIASYLLACSHSMPASGPTLQREVDCGFGHVSPPPGHHFPRVSPVYGASRDRKRLSSQPPHACLRKQPFISPHSRLTLGLLLPIPPSKPFDSSDLLFPVAGIACNICQYLGLVRLFLQLQGLLWNEVGKPPESSHQLHAAINIGLQIPSNRVSMAVFIARLSTFNLAG